MKLHRIEVVYVNTATEGWRQTIHGALGFITAARGDDNEPLVVATHSQVTHHGNRDVVCGNRFHALTRLTHRLRERLGRGALLWQVRLEDVRNHPVLEVYDVHGARIRHGGEVLSIGRKREKLSRSHARWGFLTTNRDIGR